MNAALHPAMVGVSRRVIVSSAPLKTIASLEEKAIPTLSTNEEKDLSNVLADRDFIIALGGLGGEFGGWALGVVGRVARILGDTALALATVPFNAEGMLRRQLAETQLATLRRRADGVVAFDPATEKFTDFKSILPFKNAKGTNSTYGAAGDRETPSRPGGARPSWVHWAKYLDVEDAETR